LQASLASAERAFALMDQEPEVAERPAARRLHHAQGAVKFEKVGFSYRDGQEVLRGISFEVHPGAKVGIQGTTGAGKTTLMSLLTRFYDPTAGAILLDGVDLRDYKLRDLRDQFAIVLQEPVLFSTSIAENIAYGRPGATKAEIVEAACLANGVSVKLLCKYGMNPKDAVCHRGGVCREAMVYEHLIRPLGLRPRYFGSHQDASSDQTWLAIEYPAKRRPCFPSG